MRNRYKASIAAAEGWHFLTSTDITKHILEVIATKALSLVLYHQKILKKFLKQVSVLWSLLRRFSTWRYPYLLLGTGACSTAPVARPQLSIDTEQQTRWPPLPRSIDGTDRRMDAGPLHRLLRACVNNETDIFTGRRQVLQDCPKPLETVVKIFFQWCYHDFCCWKRDIFTPKTHRMTNYSNEEEKTSQKVIYSIDGTTLPCTNQFAILAFITIVVWNMLVGYNAYKRAVLILTCFHT